MRCARCDRVASPQVLARSPDGRLVFGWCAACLADEGCVAVESAAAPLRLSTTEPPMRRLRRVARRARRALLAPRPPMASRRLAVVGVAGLLAAWSLILMFVAGVKLWAAPDGKGPWLMAASGLTALVSLAAWIPLMGRDGPRVALKIAQVAGATAAFGTLAWGLLLRDPKKAPSIVLGAGAAVGISWLARRFELRAARRGGKFTAEIAETAEREGE